MQLGRKKFILGVWSLIPEQIEGNDHTSRINVFLVSQTEIFAPPYKHDIVYCVTGENICFFRVADDFFSTGGQKISLFPLRGQ